MSGTLAIPASAIVSVIPSVIDAGGNALDLNGILLSSGTRVPMGQVLSFPTQTAVAAFFGVSSQEALLATNYFLGFDNSNQKPGAMLVTQYNPSPVRAWLRGGSVNSYTLTQLQALSGVLTVVTDGVSHTSTAINLSAATSFSNAAEIVSVALNLAGVAGATFTGAIAGTTLTVSAISFGILAVGHEIRGAGVIPGTLISALGTGTGAAGTYTITNTQTVSSEAMTSITPTVTFDSVTGSFYVVSSTTGATSTITYATGTIAAGLKLLASTGATISKGADAALPATFMSSVTAVTQNWAVFTTSFDPDNGSGNAAKQAFAAWVESTVDRYAYVAWDTDISPTLTTNATTSLGNILETANSDGTILVYSPSQGSVIAAFVMGMIASIDFTQVNGRITLAYKSQSGITPDVTDQTTATNLIANGYNFYGRYGTANDDFNFFYDGSITGSFSWADSYINQIWLNNQFQLAMLDLLTQVSSIPYNAAGYGLVQASLIDPIKQGVDFGAIRAGVTLSQAQIAQVNNAAGKKVDPTLTVQGWYLQIRDALPQVRAARASPPMTFWYMDGQSIQKLSLASVEVQ